VSLIHTILKRMVEAFDRENAANAPNEQHLLVTHCDCSIYVTMRLCNCSVWLLCVVAASCLMWTLTMTIPQQLNISQHRWTCVQKLGMVNDNEAFFRSI